MTPDPASEPAGADPDDTERCLHEVWEKLSARGFIIDEPVTGVTCQSFYKNLRNASCEMDLLDTGALVWIYTPWTGFIPDQAARLVLALLSGTRIPPAAMPLVLDPGLALKDTAGRMLVACGMAARPADIQYGPGEVSAEVIVTNPAGPARGHVRVSGEGTIRWECCFAVPGSPAPGLAPLDIAQAITAALAGAVGEGR